MAFYDNSILSGTKIAFLACKRFAVFYDNSILSGTKILGIGELSGTVFYDNSILSGTKIYLDISISRISFTITQFFQVLKLYSMQ